MTAKTQALLICAIGLTIPFGMSGAGGVSGAPLTGRVDFRVETPLAADEAVYTVDWWQGAEPGVTAPAPYLIEWTYAAAADSTRARGFAAGDAAGNAWTLRGDRLSEWHLPADSAVLDAPGALHRVARFADLLPAALPALLAELEADPTWTVTREPGRVVAEQTLDGDVNSRRVWTLDAATGAPLRMTADNNIGGLAEQTVTAVYGPLPAGVFDGVAVIDEETLTERWPDAFAHARDSDHAFAALVGQPMPRYNLPAAGMETDVVMRIEHMAGEPYDGPTLIVLIDPAAEFTVRLVRDVRRAVDSMPVNTGVLWAFDTTNPDAAWDALGNLRSGEQAAFNAARLVARTGAPALPAILVCDRRGTVTDTILGYNSDICARLIEGAN